MSQNLSAYQVFIVALFSGALFGNGGGGVFNMLLSNKLQKQRLIEQWNRDKLYENYKESISCLGELRISRRVFNYEILKSYDIHGVPGITSHNRKIVHNRKIDEALKCYNEAELHLSLLLAEYPDKTSKEFEEIENFVNWFRTSFNYLFSSNSISEQNNKLLELQNRIIELKRNDPRLK